MKNIILWAFILSGFVSPYNASAMEDEKKGTSPSIRKGPTLPSQASIDSSESDRVRAEIQWELRALTQDIEMQIRQAKKGDNVEWLWDAIQKIEEVGKGLD